MHSIITGEKIRHRQAYHIHFSRRPELLRFPLPLDVILLVAVFMATVSFFSAAEEIGGKASSAVKKKKPAVPEVQMTVWAPMSRGSGFVSVPDWRTEENDYRAYMSEARPGRAFSSTLYVRRGLPATIAVELRNNWGMGYTRRGEIPREVTFSISARMDAQQPGAGNGLSESYYPTTYYRSCNVPPSSERLFHFAVQIPRMKAVPPSLQLKIKGGYGGVFDFNLVDLDGDANDSGKDLVLFLSDNPFNTRRFTGALAAARKRRFEQVIEMLPRDNKEKDIVVKEQGSPGNNPDAANLVEAAKKEKAREVTGVTLVGDEIRALPPSWCELEIADMIVIVGTPVAFRGKNGPKLTGILTEWVAAGGHLVCLPGKDAAAFNSAGFADVFGVEELESPAGAGFSFSGGAGALPTDCRSKTLDEPIDITSCLYLRPTPGEAAFVHFIKTPGGVKIPVAVTTRFGLGRKTVLSIGVNQLLGAKPSVLKSERGLRTKGLTRLFLDWLDERHDGRLMHPTVAVPRDESVFDWEASFISKWKPGEFEDFGNPMGLPVMNDYSGSNVLSRHWSPWWEAVLARERFEESLLMDSPVVIPSSARAAQFMLIYLLMVVPVNFVAFGLIRRREWAWGVVPVLAVLFALGAYRIGYQGKTGRLTVNEISFIETSSNSPVGRATAFLGLYSPSEKDYDVRVDNISTDPDEDLFCRGTFDAVTGHLVTRVMNKNVSPPPPVEIDQTHQDSPDSSYSMMRGIHVLDRWARCLETEAVVDLKGGVAGDVRIEPDGLHYKLTNSSGRTIRFPTIVYSLREGEQETLYAGSIPESAAEIGADEIASGEWEDGRTLSGVISPVNKQSPEYENILLMFSGPRTDMPDGDSFPGRNKYNEYYRLRHPFRQPDKYILPEEQAIQGFPELDTEEARWRECIAASRRLLRPDLDINEKDPEALRLHLREMVRTEAMLRWLFARNSDVSPEGWSYGIRKRGYFHGPVLIGWTNTAAVPVRIAGQDKTWYNGMTLLLVHLEEENSGE